MESFYGLLDLAYVLISVSPLNIEVVASYLEWTLVELQRHCPPIDPERGKAIVTFYFIV